MSFFVIIAIALQFVFLLVYSGHVLDGMVLYGKGLSNALGVASALCRHFSPTHVKYIMSCKLFYLILYEFSIKVKDFGIQFYDNANVFFKYYIFLCVKKIFEMFPTQNILHYLPQCNHKNAWWNTD